MHWPRKQETTQRPLAANKGSTGAGAVSCMCEWAAGSCNGFLVTCGLKRANACLLFGSLFQRSAKLERNDQNTVGNGGSSQRTPRRIYLGIPNSSYGVDNIYKYAYLCLCILLYMEV